MKNNLFKSLLKNRDNWECLVNLLSGEKNEMISFLELFARYNSFENDYPVYTNYANDLFHGSLRENTREVILNHGFIANP